MLEQETDTIIDAMRTATIGEAEQFPLKALLASRLPGGIRTYVHEEVVQRLTADVHAGKHFRQVLVQGSLPPPTLHSLLHACAIDYVFPRQDYLVLLDHAVHFLMNYSCRPQWTLAEFLFSGSGVLTRNELSTRLGYVSDYPYYASLLHSVMEKKGWTTLDVHRFRTIVRTIDEHVTGRYTGRDLALLPRPVFELLAWDPHHAGGTIPLKPLSVFYADKGLDVLRNYLEQMCHMRKKEKVTLHELTEMLDGFEARHSSEDAPETFFPPVSRTPTGKPEPDATVSPEEFAESLPDDTDDAASSPPPPEPVPVTGEVPAATPKTNHSLALTFAGIAPRNSQRSLKDRISDELRTTFIKKLFGKDAAYYTGVIESLDTIPTWKEASHYLNSFFETNGLDPYADAVVLFTDTVYQHYHPTQAAGE